MKACSVALLLFFACARIQNPQERLPDPSPAPTAFATKTRVYWPTAEWRAATPDQAGMDGQALARLDEYAFKRTGDDIDRKGIRTDGVVIIRDGRLIHEKYAR